MNEYGFDNYLRSEVNGGVSQINPNDTNINPTTGCAWTGSAIISTSTRRPTAGIAWIVVSNFSGASGTTNLVRSDLAGKAMQVGLMHATFNTVHVGGAVQKLHHHGHEF